MLLWLFDYFVHAYHWVAVFHYITLRSILATLTSLLIVLLLGPRFIRRLMSRQLKQVIRECGPKTHMSKAGTPTMGGGLILIAIAISSLSWCKLNNVYVWLVLLVALAFGGIGWLDDMRKIIYKNSCGLRAKWKYLLQSFVALLAAIFLYYHASLPAQLNLFFPIFKNIVLHLGIFFIVLSYFVIVGASNAVNLTDGLDGLAILPTVMISVALGIFAYLVGNLKFSIYLLIPHIPNVGELSVICGSIVGAGLGFLWYNTYPAQVFMGDVGALGLGAALGTIAVIIRQELVLFLMSGVFVMETVSVIVQIISFKLFGKRVFKMAPIHHHFELKGWPEPRVIVRFWIITFILVLLGLATIKLR